jgi:hypothetical protein
VNVAEPPFSEFVRWQKPETIHALFTAVEGAVLASGGDGDGFVVTSHYREMADMFEAWHAAQNNPWWTRRPEKDEMIWFSNEQEGICFLRKHEPVPGWAEIIVYYL